MLLLLQKTLAMLIMPLGLVWMLLLGVMLWSRKFRRPAFTAGLGLLWILLGVTGNPWVGRCMVARLERQYPAPPEEGPVLDAVFVLGGGTELDAQGRPRRFRPQELVPQMEGLRLTQLALWEMVGQALGR